MHVNGSQEVDTVYRKDRKIGAAIVGLGGAVASTIIAGIEMLKVGQAGEDGLPLAHLPPQLVGELAPYSGLVFGGWDVKSDDLSRAIRTHRVLSESQTERISPALENVRPWKAVANNAFCRKIEGAHVFPVQTHREAVGQIQSDLRRFQAEHELDSLVVVNLASTESVVDRTLPMFQSLNRFEAAMDANSPEINPAMLYAYSAIRERAPFINFTPSVAADIPALIELAKQSGVPLCGKDGKTGQTFLKTVLAPALRARALHVDGWYSTNILGNRDGLALSDQGSLASKVGTKGSVLEQILGYPVEDHLIDIRYYKPRGDNKESWDNIDITGFLGQPMQIKVNFLCRDSILAAPLVIELIRLMDLAQRRGLSGVQPQLGVFFKQPMAEVGQNPENAFQAQQDILLSWLENSPVKSDLDNSIRQLESVAGD